MNYTGASGQTLAWPWRVKALENVVVRSVALGARHTVILDKHGKLLPVAGRQKKLSGSASIPSKLAWFLA